MLPVRRAAGTSGQAACAPADALVLTLDNSVERAYHAALPKPLVAPCTWTLLADQSMHNYHDPLTVNMPGYDPYPDPVDAETGCQALCQAREACVGYTWRKGTPSHGNYHKCWLVSHAGGAPVARPGQMNSALCVRGEAPVPANATMPSIFNHVQVEVGGFHDSIFEVGKSFNRDGSASPEQPMKVVLNGKAGTSNVPTFSKEDVARLTSLFHHDKAAIPDEQMVELQVIGEGIPGGRFVWYANPVYAYLSPELLSFLSLNLLTPTSITISLELVDNFCPLVHMAKRETTMEVIEQVYRALFAALAPLPTFSVFGFTQFDEPYPGLTHGITPLRQTLNDFMFFRDETSPKQFVTLTRNAARSANVIFQAMLTFNIMLTFLSAVLFVYFAIKVAAHKKKLMLFELVESYRHDLGAVQYVTLEKEHKKQEMQEKAESSKIEYKIITRTSDTHRDGGMFGRVFVTLVGKTDETREIALDDEQGRDVFGKGDHATFTVKAADVGRIARVRVRSAPLSAAFGNPDWLLDSISVMAPRFVPSDKPPFLDVRETVHFPCNRWFSEIERDQNAKVGTSHDGANVKAEDEGLQQILLPGELPDGMARAKPGGRRRSMFSKQELKQRLEVPSDEEDSSDDEMEEDMQLDECRRTLLHRQLTDSMVPRASPFWLVDVMLCVDKRRSDVKKMGGELDPRQEDETCRLFKHKLLNKYLGAWGDKVEEGRREIQKKYPGLTDGLQLDADGCRVVDPETGRALGQTIIRQGVAKGYRAKKTLISDMSEEQRIKLKKKSDLEMEQNFHLFDTQGLELIGAAEVRVAMKARGIFMSMREAVEVVKDLDLTGDGKMNLSEYKVLVELKSRELPENYEAMFAYKLFADPVLDCINFKQLKRVCVELGQDLDDTSLVEMIDRVDLKGEGVVTKDEFLTVMGTPTDAEAIIAKIKGLPMPKPPGGGDWPVSNSKRASDAAMMGNADRVMFERLVLRYWRRFRMMTDDEKDRFLACCAYAAVPGNYMDTLPGMGTLALIGMSKKEARGILKHARTQMRLESFQAWFALNSKEQALMVRTILEFPSEYFYMGITKRRWFYKQSVPDRLHYLKQAQGKAQADLSKEFRAKLALEAESAFVHLVILFAPTIPLMMAGSLFDNTYKKFNPDSNQSAYGGTFILCLVINSIYIGAGFAYLVWYYVVKNIKSRMGREGPVEKKLRLVNYFFLFLVLFMAVLVLVCVLYWIVLGTVLNPQEVVPIMISVSVFFTCVTTQWGTLQKFRRVILTKIGEMAKRAQTMRLKAAAFKSRVTAQKTALLVQAHTAKGKEAHVFEHKAHKLAASEDKLREVMAQCGRTDNVLTEFLVKQGFSSADIIVAVIGSALTLLLLLIFIAVGVAAFTTPGSVAASVNSGLALVAGKASSGASDSANSPDKLERLVDLAGQAADVVLGPAAEALEFAQEDALEYLPEEDN
jgi:Ca2+-binding EF-hand superfamily protein